MLPTKPTLHMDDAATHIGTSEEHKNACSIPKAQKRKSNIDIMRKQKKLTVSEIVRYDYGCFSAIPLSF